MTKVCLVAVVQLTDISVRNHDTSSWFMCYMGWSGVEAADRRTFSACSLAQAAVSGCGDAYAAGVGISIANLAATGPEGLAGVLSTAFSGAVSVSRTIGDAAAVSQGIAVAFASALPCEM